MDIKTKRKEMKRLYEMNQYIKTVFSEYIIHKGIIYGEVVKNKIDTGLFYLLDDTYDFLESFRLDSMQIYQAFKNSKPTDIIIEDDKVVIVDEENDLRFVVSKHSNDRVVYNTRIFKLFEDKKDKDSIKFILSEEDIDKIKSYDKIRLNVGTMDECRIIDFTISVMPLATKMKNCTIESFDIMDVGSDKEYFDIFLHCVDTKNGIRFTVLRRFGNIYTEDDL